MPELPEVETVRRGLAAHVVGRTVAGAVFLGPRVVRRHLPGPQDLADSLRGYRVASAQRRGKYLWLVMEPGSPGDGYDDGSACGPDDAVGSRFALLLHLGMSGQLLVKDPAAPAEPHLRAVLDFMDTPTRGTQLRFVDQRTFGGMARSDLIDDPGRPDGIPAAIAHIAPDPLEPAFDLNAVVATMKRRDSAVKRALLDQSLVSGIGNIYADEALWRAKVHGERRCAALTRPALGRVLLAARDVMEQALAAGGTSFDSLYVNVNGASGYFDRSLHAYGQEGRPCDRCGTLIKREHFMNRSSFFCPRCQRRPPAGA